MTQLIQSFTDLEQAEAAIQERRYGVIQTAKGEFEKIVFRPWPKLISGLEANWWSSTRGGETLYDECRLYFAAPMSAPGFLALSYIRSTMRTTLATFRLAVRLLDHVARLKNSDAIVCEAFNRRISDRLLKRWGWEQHLLASKRRHWIKRFYGDYSVVASLSEILGKGPDDFPAIAPTFAGLADTTNAGTPV